MCSRICSKILQTAGPARGLRCSRHIPAQLVQTPAHSPDLAVMQPYGFVTQFFDLVIVMSAENQGAAVGQKGLPSSGRHFF